MKDNFSVVEAWIDCYNKRDLVRAKELFADDAIHDWIPDEIVKQGPDEIVEGMGEVFKGFPDHVTRITNHVEEGDTVVIEVAWTGTLKGEFLGAKPTGKSFKLRAVFVIELEKGKMKSVREYYPNGLLNKQLGIN